MRPGDQLARTRRRSIRLRLTKEPKGGDHLRVRVSEDGGHPRPVDGPRRRRRPGHGQQPGRGRRTTRHGSSCVGYQGQANIVHSVWCVDLEGMRRRDVDKTVAGETRCHEPPEIRGSESLGSAPHDVDHARRGCWGPPCTAAYSGHSGDAHCAPANSRVGPWVEVPGLNYMFNSRMIGTEHEA